MRNVKCGACMHAERSRLDADLLAGVSLREVGRRYSISKDTAHRHSDHIAADARAEVRQRAEVDVTALASRIVSIADDARATRLHAQARGDHRAALRASEVELRTLDVLATRLGIDSSDVGTVMEQSQAVQRTVAVLVRRHPELTGEIADELRRDGHADVADAISQFAAKYPSTTTNEEIER